MTPHTGSCTLATSSPRKRAVPTRWTSRPGFPDTNSRDTSLTLALSSPAWRAAYPRGWEPQPRLEATMSVLVTTTDGYHIFTSNGQHLTALGGQRVEALAPGPDGTC